MRKPRSNGKRAVDLSEIKTTVESHYLEDNTLMERFPKGWHQLEDEVYKELKRIPPAMRLWSIISVYMPETGRTVKSSVEKHPSVC